MLAPAVLLGLAVVVLSGCSAGAVPRKEGARAPAPAVPAGGVLLRGAGATFPSVLYEKWFSVYQAGHPNRVIAYEAVGSGEGVRRFVGQHVDDEERVDFGASDAAMRDDEIAAVREGAHPRAGHRRQRRARLQPARPRRGSPALAPGLRRHLHRGDPQLERSADCEDQSGREAAEPHDRHRRSSGRQRHDVRVHQAPGRDQRRVAHAVRRGDAGQLAGQLDARERQRGRGGAHQGTRSARSATSATNSPVGRVCGSALLENQAGTFVAPSEQSSAAALADAELPENMRLYVPDPAGADAYPIVTLTWILLYRHYPDSPTSQALHDLFRWCLTDGQQYASELGYAPLPPNIVQRSLAALDALR